MNRAIEARLSKVEKLVSPDEVDEFGFNKLSDEDLLRRLRELMLEAIARPDVTEDEKVGLREKLANLEAQVWQHASLASPVDVIAALDENRTSGRICHRIVDPENGDVPRPDWWMDWTGLAREWGLIDSSRNLGQKGPPRLIERVIVSPPEQP